MDDIFSIALYLFTFLSGIIIDAKCNNKARMVFVIWLYVFLCFGYMTGSDWRVYELYYNGKSFQKDIEIGYVVLNNLLRTFIPDFFVALALLKCIYLYSLIKFLKVYTSNWLSVISILMPMLLLFILIDNPLRFMIALIFVNFALMYYRNNRKKTCYFLLLASVLFHNTAMSFIIIPIVYRYVDKIYKTKSVILLLIYIVVLIVSSDINLVNSVKLSVLVYIQGFVDMKDYTQTYTAENNDATFTLGAIINIVVFILILSTKRFINKDSENDVKLFGMAIVALILTKIVTLIPVGFRLVIPYNYFYAMYLVLLLKHRHIVGYIVSLYLAIVLVKNVYNAYVYIPYSNSIPYIITQNHLPYSERSKYNYDAASNRIGLEHAN